MSWEPVFDEGFSLVWLGNPLMGHEKAAGLASLMTSCDCNLL